MSNQEKDRLGDKLREIEHAREDLFFAERDKALLAKLRAKSASAHGSCPACGEELVEEPSAAVCRNGHGAWLSRAQLAEVAQHGGVEAVRGILARLG